MDNETVAVPRQVLIKLAENNKKVLEKLEAIAARLKTRKGFFSFFVGAHEVCT